MVYTEPAANLRYRPFHKTLPRTSVSVNWLSVRFYEMDCSLRMNVFFSSECLRVWIYSVRDRIKKKFKYNTIKFMRLFAAKKNVEVPKLKFTKKSCFTITVYFTVQTLSWFLYLVLYM